MNPYHILLLEDEAELLNHTQACLKAEGYRVTAVSTLAQAHTAAREEPPDLLVLDILLPDGSGLDLCRDLRAVTGAPIIFLTSLSQTDQVVAGLRAGGDDYLVKPCRMAELLARIEAQLRRVALLRVGGDLLETAGLRLDLIRQQAYWRGKDLLLKPKEFQLLALLMRSKNRYATAAELYTGAWGRAACDTRTVTMQISNLRQKLRDATDCALDVEQSRQRGYRLYFEESNWPLSQ